MDVLLSSANTSVADNVVAVVDLALGERLVLSRHYFAGAEDATGHAGASIRIDVTAM